MVENILFAPLIFGFLATLLSTHIWIRRAKIARLVGKDMHKSDKREVAEGGGIVVLFGFVLGVLVYIAIKTFILKTNTTTVEIFALLSSILIVGFVGFVDDILGWRIGLNKKTRILFVLFAAIPLIVINAGESTILGIEVGLLWPLFFVPLGIVGASTTFNFMAGYNGLEASQGILILSALALVAWLVGNGWLSLICLIMVFCLFAFYLFNKCPAKVLPGDVLTYTVGALIAIVAILGNMEKMAVFFFIPYFIETGLKVRGNLKKQSFAKLKKDGSLDLPYDKFYGVEHIAIHLLKKIKRKVWEEDVVYAINLFQLLIILTGFVLFRGALF